jgi:MFS family permease
MANGESNVDRYESTRLSLMFLSLRRQQIFSIPLAIIKNASGFIGMSAVLGLGAAMLAPAATGIISESLPDGKFKNGAFGALGAGQPLGFIFGLLIGGVFANKQYAIYTIAAGAAGIFASIAFFTLPEDGEKLQVKGARILTQDERNERAPKANGSLLAFDWGGALLSTVGVVLLTLGLAFAGSNSSGWRSIPVLVCLPLSVFMIATFFIWESHKQRQSSSYEEGQSQRPLKAPLIPPSVWRVPKFSPTLAVVFLAWSSFK